ncbi:putative Reverse transcriptase (RNA-dependent DNA polymerase)/RNase H [Trypanosoma cruzi]|nr:putative Reverse transcriptase (RNA-dependent DNA polymerase)/RNase H [Trypanosoma cruzi]
MSNPSHDHGGIANYEASWHGSRATTDAKCGGHQATRCHFATGISQLRCIAHKEAGPSPHDLRTFVIGYGASKLRYGSELLWAVATDPAKNEMQKTYATLARIVSGVPSTVDPESALLEANMPPLHVLCLCARLSIFENTRACQMDWMRRPPPEPPPRAGFRISPLSRDELYAFVDAYTKDYGITQSSPREGRFFRSSIPPWFAASAHRVTIGVELPIDHSITDEEELTREKRRVSEEALALHSHRSWILATGWRCRRSQVSRGWNPAFIPQFIGDNRKGQYKLRCTPMQLQDGIPRTASSPREADYPSYPTQA